MSLTAADLLGRDPANPGNFLPVSDLESVFLGFAYQKIPDILRLSGCGEYPPVFLLRDGRDPVFLQKCHQFQIVMFIEAAADAAAFLREHYGHLDEARRQQLAAYYTDANGMALQSPLTLGDIAHWVEQALEATRQGA